MMLDSAFLLSLVVSLITPTNLSYFLHINAENENVTVETSPSVSVVTSSPNVKVKITTPQGSPSPSPSPSPSTQPSATPNNDGRSSKNCDFEYHLDTSKQDQNSSNGNVVINHECEQEVANGGHVASDVDIKVNTGNKNSEGEENSENISTGDVKINVSVKNNVK